MCQCHNHTNLPLHNICRHYSYTLDGFGTEPNVCNICDISTSDYHPNFSLNHNNTD